MEAAARFMLPDDMVLEILARVEDVAALFRCATACKAWRRLLVADTSFLHWCLSAKACRSSPFPGFFAKLQCDGGPAAPCLVPTPRPVLGSGLRFLGSLLEANSGFFDDAVPLVSRRGLLLVRLSNVKRPTGVHLAVCNLLAGTVQVLPCLHGLYSDNLDETGYAFLAAADCLSSNDDQQHLLTSSFKVLVIDIREYAMVYRLRTYSSIGEPRWTMCSGNSAEYGHIRSAFRQPNAVVCNGVAHWLLWSSLSLYTLNVNAKTGHVSFTMLPDELPLLYFRVGYDEPYLSVDTKEERLTLIYLQKEYLRLEFWIWNDHNEIWTARVVELKQSDRQENASGSVMYWCMGEKNGTVIIKGNDQRVYVVDFRTEVMQEITDWPHDYLIFRSSISRQTLVPMEMDWPAYFLSWLGIAK